MAVGCTFFLSILGILSVQSVTLTFERKVNNDWTSTQASYDGSQSINTIVLGTDTIQFDTIEQTSNTTDGGITAVELTTVDSPPVIIELRDASATPGEIAKFIDAVAIASPMDLESVWIQSMMTEQNMKAKFADISDVDFVQVGDNAFQYMVSLDAAQVSSSLTTSAQQAAQSKSISDYFASLSTAQISGATVSVNVVQSLGGELDIAPNTLLELKAEILEGEPRRRRRRHHHHHSTQHDMNFEAHTHHRKKHAHRDYLSWVTDQVGGKDDPLRGGVSMGPLLDGSQGGTLGGILVGTTNPFTKYIITNSHVVKTLGVNDNACQPAPAILQLAAKSDALQCNPVGKKVVSDGGVVANGADPKTITSDWALLSIDDSRKNVACKVGNRMVNGRKDSLLKAKVDKFGARTAMTSGYIDSVRRDVSVLRHLCGCGTPDPNEDLFFGADYRIQGCVQPILQAPDAAAADMKDMKDVKAGKIGNCDAVTTFPDATAAANDATFVRQMTSELKTRIKANYKDPGTKAAYSDSQLDNIAQGLINAGRIRSLFAFAGDSGSLIMEGNTVSGLLVGGEWVMDSSGLDTITLENRDWGYMDRFSYGYKISRVVSALNSKMPSNNQVDVCVEDRPAKPNNDGECYWNYGAARCDPAHWCVYKFKPSANPRNWHLGYSCALKSEVQVALAAAS